MHQHPLALWHQCYDLMCNHSATTWQILASHPAPELWQRYFRWWGKGCSVFSRNLAQEVTKKDRQSSERPWYAALWPCPKHEHLGGKGSKSCEGSKHRQLLQPQLHSEHASWHSPDVVVPCTVRCRLWKWPSSIGAWPDFDKLFHFRSRWCSGSAYHVKSYLVL